MSPPAWWLEKHRRTIAEHGEAMSRGHREKGSIDRELLELWGAGVTKIEIAVRLKLSATAINHRLIKLRALGWQVERRV